MRDNIELNGEEYVFSENDLPCLVTYGEGMGGSHISIFLIANLFLSGSKILFITAFPMGKQNFLEQVGLAQNIALVDSVGDLQNAFGAQAIILKSGEEALFLEALKTIPDLQERVVLLKNVELFNEAVVDAALKLNKIILSGNLDACIYKEKIVRKNFKTLIAFNQPQTDISITIPPLEKYTAFLSSNTKSGIITLKNN